MSNGELRDRTEREIIRTRLDVNMLVEAGAGSGKTESLAGRMVETVASGACEVGEIAAVTFTKKAASELRGRFRLELERQIPRETDAVRRERLTAATSRMERMFAGTIHSFCANLLRERPVEAGLAPGFREIEEPEDAMLRRKYWREYVDQKRAAASPDLAALIAAEVKPSDLDGAFATVCAHPDVEFPAGDAPEPEAQPVWQSLDRFWRSLKALCPPIQAGTTCGIQKLMRDFESRYLNAARDRLAPLASLLSEWDKDLKVVQKWWNGPGKQADAIAGEFRRTTVRPFLTAWRAYVYRLALVLLIEARAYAERERQRSALLNFTDLLLYSSRVVRENTQVRQALQRKYRRIFVDEFQDTDPMQAELLFLLAAEPDVGADWTRVPLRPGALFLVGDPKQSIYRFRRADIEIYQTARRRIEETGGVIVPLTSCFRSGPAICDWANTVFSGMFPAQPTAQEPAYQSLNPCGTDPTQSPGVWKLIHPAGVEQKELRAADARAIAGFVRQTVESGTRSWGDFLVLTRKKRGRLGDYTAVFDAARIPYEVSGSGGLLDSLYVEALMGVVVAATRPEDGIAVIGALRGACFGISDPELYEYRRTDGVFNLSVPVPPEMQGPVAAALRTLQGWRKLIRELPGGAALTRILEESGLLAKAVASSPGGGEAGKLMYAVDCLRASCESGLSLADAVLALEEAIDDESDAPVLEPGRRDVVRIMNLHKAKGLEGKVVFLADPLGGVRPRANLRVVREGGTTGYIAVTKPRGEYQEEILAAPLEWDRYEAEEFGFVEAEERRLLYVAATRARETLIVSEWEGKPRGTVVRPWQKLSERIAADRKLVIPALPEDPVTALPDLSAAARAAAVANRQARRDEITAPGYSVVAISSLATSGGREVDSEIEGPAGRDWGSLIHALLEYAAANVECSRGDLEAIARFHLGSSSTLIDSIPEALDTIEAVRSSSFWIGVKSAAKRMTEVPVGGMQTGPVPRIARGIVDLAFETAEGWHIVDYKTDIASLAQLEAMYGLQVRTYAEIWQRATGQRIAFAGLFSVRERRLSGDVRPRVTTTV